MNDLREVVTEPEFLEKKGFVRREEETTDSVRWVWYEKVIDSVNSQIRFIVQIEFELFISDNCASYIENRDYGFNGIYLRVIDRQIEALDNISYDDEYELLRETDRWALSIHTVSRLKSFCEMLGDRTWRFTRKKESG